MSPLFGKRRKAAPTIVSHEVRAELVPTSPFPPPAPPPAESCARRVRIESAPSGPVIHEDAHAPTPSSGFVVPDQRLAFLNRDGEFQFDVWDLADTGALDSPRDPPQFHKDQDDWVGFYVIGAAGLVGGRVLVGLTIYNPRPTHGLCLYSPAADGFRWMGFVDADIRDPSRVFEHRVLPGDRAIVISYSGRTRKAAEIYHNYYNHVYAFTAQRAGGVEVAQIGIDTGNIRDWDVQGATLLLHTVDDRDPKKPHEGYWSLDLRRVLGT